MLNEEALSPVDKDLLERRGYKGLRQIGEGSESVVYLFEYQGGGGGNPEDADGPRLLLACKLIETAKLPKDLATKFLSREIDVISRVRHPNIIHLHSILQRETKYFIFMRYAEYGNLCDYIMENGAVKERQARVWTHQVAAGLGFLHALDIAHRDVKCENILITRNSNVKLADFGFSRSTVDGKGRPARSSTYCGSLAYAAPELVRGSPYDPKPADLWSLGVVIYIMLNRSMPFKSDNLTQLWIDQINKNYRFRTKALMEVSDEAVEVVSRLLEPEVELRASLDDVLDSDWMEADPRLSGLTPKEAEALEAALGSRPQPIAKLPKKPKDLAVIRKERLPDESSTGLVLPTAKGDASQADLPLANDNKNPETE